MCKRQLTGRAKQLGLGLVKGYSVIPKLSDLLCSSGMDTCHAFQEAAKLLRFTVPSRVQLPSLTSIWPSTCHFSQFASASCLWLEPNILLAQGKEVVLICKHSNPAEINKWKKTIKRPAKEHIFIEIDKSKCSFSDQFKLQHTLTLHLWINVQLSVLQGYLNGPPSCQ